MTTKLLAPSLEATGQWPLATLIGSYLSCSRLELKDLAVVEVRICCQRYLVCLVVLLVQVHLVLALHLLVEVVLNLSGLRWLNIPKSYLNYTS